MLLYVCLVLTAIAVWPSYDLVDGAMPMYIKKALQEKTDYKPAPRAKSKVLRNLTLQEVFANIKAITMKLSQHAKRNGYKVDYRIKVIHKKTKR